MTIGERLKEERKRLALTQPQLAEACGVGKRAQINFEGGDNWPGGAYLAKAAQLGIDVIYVLTGKREGALDPEEQRVLAGWRNASPEAQRMVLAALGASDSAPGRVVQTSNTTTIHADKIGQSNTGPVTQHGTKIRMAGDRIKKKG